MIGDSSMLMTGTAGGWGGGVGVACSTGVAFFGSPVLGDAPDFEALPDFPPGAQASSE